MSDKFWLLGLLVITIGCLCGMFVAAAYGESREQCVAVNNSKVIIIGEDFGFDGGDCNWIANEVIMNDNYSLNAYTDKYPSLKNLWVFLK